MSCTKSVEKIAGHCVDIERMSLITGREVDYICRQAMKINSKGHPALSNLAKTVDASTARMNFLTEVRVGRVKVSKSKWLLPWIELAQLEKDFIEIAPHVSTGTILELIFLWRVARICPGE